MPEAAGARIPGQAGQEPSPVPSGKGLQGRSRPVPLPHASVQTGLKCTWRGAWTGPRFLFMWQRAVLSAPLCCVWPHAERQAARPVRHLPPQGRVPRLVADLRFCPGLALWWPRWPLPITLLYPLLPSYQTCPAAGKTHPRPEPELAGGCPQPSPLQGTQQALSFQAVWTRVPTGLCPGVLPRATWAWACTLTSTCCWASRHQPRPLAMPPRPAGPGPSAARLPRLGAHSPASDSGGLGHSLLLCPGSHPWASCQVANEAPNALLLWPP